MKQQRFDAVVMELVEERYPRRHALVAVGWATLAGLLAHFGGGRQATAAVACLKVGKKCRRAKQCCSGVCRGRRGDKTCRRHGAGTCKQEGQHLVCTAPDITLSHCNNNSDCACVRTTAGTNFCGDFFFPSGCTTCSGCAVCERDADCVKQGFPPGSACTPFSAGRCAGVCESGTRCMVPCGTVPREP